MRVLLNLEIDTATGNELIAGGHMGTRMQEVLGALQPEAAYFYPRDGHRAFTLVVERADGASLPALLEPFWSTFGGRAEAVPCMSAEELADGLSRMG